jgi:hypothetical protein
MWQPTLPPVSEMFALYTFAVRRCLIIFFIVFLPLQFAWVAAAPYCGHEKVDKVSHFGHHARVHKAATADTKPASLLAGDDLDCDYCHIGCAQALPSNVQNLFVASHSVYVPREPFPARFGVPELIDRPNWSFAV